MLQVENLAKTYAMRSTALEGVNLEVGRAIVAVVGASGCGKSTLLRMGWRASSSRRSAPCTSTGAGSPAPRATWVSSSRSRG